MTLVGTTVGTYPGVGHGVAVDETGLNTTRFEVAYKPEFKHYMLDRIGEKRGFAAAAVEATISMEGELLLLASGVYLFTFYTAVTLLNTIAGFGSSTGGVYMDMVTIGQSNTDWKKFKAELSRNAGIA